MKVLVTGANGQLGIDVINELLNRSFFVLATDITENYILSFDEKQNNFKYAKMDITDIDSINSVMLSFEPDAVIHCAAWTSVDDAEDPNNISMVERINHIGTKNIAFYCKKMDCKMMYISTDYVFDGKGNKPWNPDCKDFNPLNVYGKTKLDGEIAVKDLLDKYFIVRISWVFGVHGASNFVKTMLDLAKKYDTIRVVNDQIGTPTYTADLSRLLVDMIETNKYGCFNASNEGGYISWYDFAQEIFKQASCKMTIIPVTTEEYGVSKAQRPFNSRLDKRKLIDNGFEPLPDWRDALSRYLVFLGVKNEQF